MHACPMKKLHYLLAFLVSIISILLYLILKVDQDDWSDKITKEENYTDHLKVFISNNEFGEWLSNLVYQ